MKRYSEKHGRRRYQPNAGKARENFNPEDWWQRRREGFGMNLYRNVKRKKIAGVCAGLADHLNVDHWVVRLAVVGGMFFFSFLVFWAYIGAWICMAPRPKAGSVEQRYRYDENLHQDRPVNMFRYQMNPSERLKTARSRMDEIAQRVSRMESYVTSKRYELDEEFSKID